MNVTPCPPPGPTTRRVGALVGFIAAWDYGGGGERLQEAHPLRLRSPRWATPLAALTVVGLLMVLGGSAGLATGNAGQPLAASSGGIRAATAPAISSTHEASVSASGAPASSSAMIRAAVSSLRGSGGPIPGGVDGCVVTVAGGATCTGTPPRSVRDTAATRGVQAPRSASTGTVPQ